MLAATNMGVVAVRGAKDVAVVGLERGSPNLSWESLWYRRPFPASYFRGEMSLQLLI
jgi:hypothetical protein